MSATLAEIEDVYRRDFERFLRVAWSIVGDEETAYDVVQDAFARAIRHRRGFRRRGPVEAWIWRAVVNAALTARVRPVPVAEPAQNGGPPAEDSSLTAALAALPERQRLALFLRYYADLDYEAIAEVMEVSPGTVGATLNGARAALRRRLEGVER